MEFKIIVRNKTIIVPEKHEILQSIIFRPHVGKDNCLRLKNFPTNMYEELFFYKHDIFKKSCYQICEFLYFLRYIGYQNVSYMNEIYKFLGYKTSISKEFECLNILKTYISELYLICPYMLKFDINDIIDEDYIAIIREDVNNNYMRYIPVHEFDMVPYDASKQFILMCKIGNNNIVECLYYKHKINDDTLEMGYLTACRYDNEHIAMFLSSRVKNPELGYSIAIEYDSDTIIYAAALKFSDDYYNIALAQCAKCGNINIFLFLLEHIRYDPELIINCLRDAIFYDYTDICKALLDDNYYIDNSHIIYACEYGRYDIIKLLSNNCTDKTIYDAGMYKIIDYNHSNLLNLIFSLCEYDEVDIIAYIYHASKKIDKGMFSELCRFYGMKYETHICELFKMLDDDSSKILFNICIDEFTMYKIELFHIACYTKNMDYIAKFLSKEKVECIKCLNSDVLKYLLENTDIVIFEDDMLLCIEGDVKMLKYLLYETKLTFNALKVLKYGYIYPKCQDVVFEYITK